MYTFLLVLLILDSFVLAIAVLLQAGKGGGLAATFGGASSSAEAFIGMRQAGTLLTKIGWWCGGIFLALAFVLQIMSTRTRVPTSVLERPVAPAPTTPQSTRPATPAPAVPLQPAPQQTAPGTGPLTPPPPGTGTTPPPQQ